MKRKAGDFQKGFELSFTCVRSSNAGLLLVTVSPQHVLKPVRKLAGTIMRRLPAQALVKESTAVCRALLPLELCETFCSLVLVLFDYFQMQRPTPPTLLQINMEVERGSL